MDWPLLAVHCNYRISFTMNTRHFNWTTLAGFVIFSAASASSTKPFQISNQVQNSVSGSAIAYPWAFEKGTDTARKSVYRTVAEIAQKANYATVSYEVAHSNWTVAEYRTPTVKSLINTSTLRTFGDTLRANVVIYGTTSWHTRSIWVNAGPKTISTATVSVYVLDVASGNVIYNRTNIAGRSDEKSNILKVAGAILLTPLVTAVSGGPAAPQEERAAQVALVKAFADWNMLPRTK